MLLSFLLRETIGNFLGNIGLLLICFQKEFYRGSYGLKEDVKAVNTCLAPSHLFPFKGFLIGNLVRKIHFKDCFKGFCLRLPYKVFHRKGHMRKLHIRTLIREPVRSCHRSPFFFPRMPRWGTPIFVPFLQLGKDGDFFFQWAFSGSHCLFYFL